MIKIFWLSVLLIAQLFADSALSATPKLVNVDELNQKLQKQNAGWYAKDTWLNNLSRAELRQVLGLNEAQVPEIEFILPSEHIQNLPVTHDWRDFQGKNWVSPMLNQANCGSCVAFAAVGVLETQLNISSLIPNMNVRLSPQYLFGCGGGGCNFGWWPSSAADFLKKRGAPDEACLPYTSGASGQDVSCQAACADAPTRAQKISTYKTPSRSARDITAVKQALLQGPVMTTLSVYADFMTYAGGVYKKTSSEYMGGHAISIIGYDDLTQSWIIRNSWGETWGENGFGRVAYDDDSGVAESTWLFVVPPTNGYVATMSPKDYSYLSGASAFSGISNFGKTTGLRFHIYDSSNKRVMTGNCDSAPCHTNIDTTKLADGRYEVETIALDSNNTDVGKSAREFFYVINTDPKMTLAFKGLGNIDLTKPLKDRVQFEISSTSSPVPMSSLEFHVKSLSTGTETIKKSQVVLNAMTLGWRTNLVPNGDYELWLVGRIDSNGKSKSIESNHIKVQTQN